MQVVADASGSATKTSDNFALDRLRQDGVNVVSTVQILSDGGQLGGRRIMPVLGELYAAIE